MARLHEYQGKAILAANGFKIPRGRAVSSANEAVAAAKELGGEVVIKIQAWTTGRDGCVCEEPPLEMSPAAGGGGGRAHPEIDPTTSPVPTTAAVDHALAWHQTCDTRSLLS